ncbi:MAG: hypothetical protein V4480_03450 [Patescibacteria group bacterium]
MPTTYTIKTPKTFPILSCGLLPISYLALMDESSWESFDEPRLERYVREGADALALRIRQIGDVSHTIDEAETKELFFMLESLLYAKDILSVHEDAATDEGSAR